MMNLRQRKIPNILAWLILLICFSLFSNILTLSDTQAFSGEIVTLQNGDKKKNSEAAAIVIRTDGKIVAVGSADAGADSDFAIARYNPDGSLDPSFGGDGTVMTDISAKSNDAASSVSIQSNGKLIVAGWTAAADTFTSAGISNNDFAVVRYNSDGSLDTTFGNQGKVVTTFGADTSDGIAAVAIQSDEKIVAVGSTHNGSSNDFAVARYNPDGSLDKSFGGGGKLITAVSKFGDLAHAVAIQSDGKIVVAGETFINSSGVFAVLRYNSNGSLDASFDGDGTVTTQIGANGDVAKSVKVLPDGKIVTAGHSFGKTSGIGTITSSGDLFACVKYSPDGSLDTTFGQGGKATAVVRPKARAFPTSASLQSDGKIIVAGHLVNDYTVATDIVVARFSASGTLDSSFGQSGKIISKIGKGSEQANSVAIQSGGKIIVGGSAYFDPGMNFVVLRFNENGIIDASFGKAGKVITDVVK